MNFSAVSLQTGRPILCRIPVSNPSIITKSVACLFRVSSKKFRKAGLPGMDYHPISKPTDRGATVGYQREPMNPGVPAVFGAAGCQSSSPLITGTRNSVNIVSRHFVMARNPVAFISRVQHAKCQEGKACPGRRKTGWMRRQLHTGNLMNSEACCRLAEPSQ
jgi:hypothetical protein